MTGPKLCLLNICLPFLLGILIASTLLLILHGYKSNTYYNEWVCVYNRIRILVIFFKLVKANMLIYATKVLKTVFFDLLENITTIEKARKHVTIVVVPLILFVLVLNVLMWQTLSQKPICM